MAKALKIISVCLMLTSIGALVLGTMLFGKREILKARTQQNEQALSKIASNLHFEEYDASALVIDNKESLPRAQSALNLLATAAAVQYEDLQNTKLDLENTRKDLAQTRDELAATQAQLAEAKEEIVQLNQTVAEKNAEIEQLDGQVADLENENEDLKFNIEELNEQVAKVQDEIIELEDKITNLEEENKDLLAQLGFGEKKALPRGLTGRILVVNEDWDFVVIDLGLNDGMVSQAEMLIHRGDQLIGKVIISDVKDSISIADLDIDWEQAGVMEGDYVVY